jgi:hypothetical protein
MISNYLYQKEASILKYKKNPPLLDAFLKLKLVG